MEEENKGPLARIQALLQKGREQQKELELNVAAILAEMEDAKEQKESSQQGSSSAFITELVLALQASPANAATKGGQDAPGSAPDTQGKDGGQLGDEKQKKESEKGPPPTIASRHSQTMREWRKPQYEEQDNSLQLFWSPRLMPPLGPLDDT